MVPRTQSPTPYAPPRRAWRRRPGSARLRTSPRASRRSRGGSRRNHAEHTARPSLPPGRRRGWRPKSGRTRATRRRGPRQPAGACLAEITHQLLSGEGGPGLSVGHRGSCQPVGPFDGLEHGLAPFLFNVQLYKRAGIEVKDGHRPGKAYLRSSITVSDKDLAPSLNLGAPKRRPPGLGPSAGMISCSSTNISPASTGYPRPSRYSPSAVLTTEARLGGASRSPRYRSRARSKPSGIVMLARLIPAFYTRWCIIDEEPHGRTTRRSPNACFLA